jgi:hypothetical protein
MPGPAAKQKPRLLWRRLVDPNKRLEASLVPKAWATARDPHHCSSNVRTMHRPMRLVVIVGFASELQTGQNLLSSGFTVLRWPTSGGPTNRNKSIKGRPFPGFCHAARRPMGGRQPSCKKRAPVRRGLGWRQSVPNGRAHPVQHIHERRGSPRALGHTWP